MDTKKIAEIVLSQYNSEKKLKGRSNFRKIILKQYNAGIVSGMTYSEFFNLVSKECHKIQPGAKRISRNFGDTIHKAKKKFVFSTGIVTEAEVAKNERRKITELGNGSYEEGLYYLEQIQNG